jgi:hypothetical protein
VSVISPDLTETKPIERRTDTVLMADTPAGNHLIIIDAQTKPEESKLHAWPYYAVLQVLEARGPAVPEEVGPASGSLHRPHPLAGHAHPRHHHPQHGRAFTD